MFAFADEVMGLNFRYPCHTCLLFFKSVFTMLVNAASVIVERISSTPCSVSSVGVRFWWDLNFILFLPFNVVLSLC